MAKNVDFDKIVDEVETDEDFGEGIDAETPDPPEDETPDLSDEVETEDSADDPEPEDEVEEVSLRDLAQKFQFNLPEGDDVEVLEGFLQQTAGLRDWAQQAQAQLRQSQQQLQHLQYQLAQQQQPAQQPTAPPKAELTGSLKHWEKVPEWSDDWLRLVKRDENGDLVPISGADPTLPQKIMERQRWEERAQRTFFENPQQFIYEALQGMPQFQETMGQRIQQEIVTLQDRIEAQRIAEKINPYLKNQDGSLNPAGEAYMATVQECIANGIHDSQRQHQFALRAAAPYIEQMQAQAQVPAETPAESKKKRQLSFAKRQAERKPNRGNTAAHRAKAKSRPRDAVDLEREMLEMLSESGADLDARAVL